MGIHTNFKLVREGSSYSVFNGGQRIYGPTATTWRQTHLIATKRPQSTRTATAQKIEGRYGQLTEMLKISKQFQVHETSNLTVKTNRDSGEQEIQFVNEHKAPDGKPISIPNLLIIAIPVFLGGAPYRMPVRFRYRKSGANIGFILSLYNPEKIFEAAFDEAVSKATDETELLTLKGRPES